MQDRYKDPAGIHTAESNKYDTNEPAPEWIRGETRNQYTLIRIKPAITVFDSLKSMAIKKYQSARGNRQIFKILDGLMQRAAKRD